MIGFAPRFWLLSACGIALVFALGCRRSELPTAVVKTNLLRPPPTENLNLLVSQEIAKPFANHPWIAHVNTVDLDKDGRMDVLYCDCGEHKVVWLRQTAPGSFEEIVLSDDIPAPVHVEAVDIDGDGDLDLLVSDMGAVLPNNDKIGSVIILENDGHQHFTKRVIAEHIARVTDIRAGDFNGDGKLDLAVGQFGYDQGEIQWMENKGNWQFEGHRLLDISGTINVLVADFVGHHALDIAAVVSQEWEEIYLFENDGSGHFTTHKIWGSTNEDYGSSGISLADLNRDGRPDIIYSNGDGFGPAAIPGPRPWHGIQWLENMGGGFFQYHRIGDLPGAYSPVAVDMDGDGNLDIVAVAAYSDWQKADPKVVSMMLFKNDGHLNFSRQILAYFPKDLITLAVGDLDGNGRPVLVTGGFYVYPPYQHMSKVAVWRKAQP